MARDVPGMFGHVPGFWIRTEVADSNALWKKSI